MPERARPTAARHLTSTARERSSRGAVDRSQWYLDVVPGLALEPWQYDLLLAAYQGQEYGALFPQAGSRSQGDPLPAQLPEGVSCRETLPDILEWIMDEAVPAAVDRALHQRFDLMWPRKKLK